jgi:hypothetical protein
MKAGENDMRTASPRRSRWVFADPEAFSHWTESDIAAVAETQRHLDALFSGGEPAKYVIAGSTGPKESYRLEIFPFVIRLQTQRASARHEIDWDTQREQFFKDGKRVDASFATQFFSKMKEIWRDVEQKKAVVRVEKGVL